MLGYPASPAVERDAAHLPLQPLSPADKIQSSKEHELFTIQALNTRLKALLEKDRKENTELEKKRAKAKEECAKARQDLDMAKWTFTEKCNDFIGQKEIWASTEADVITSELTNADKHKLVNHLKARKSAFGTELGVMVASKQKKLVLLEAQLRDLISSETPNNERTKELTGKMRENSDILKKRMVDGVRLEASIRDLHSQKRIEHYHQTMWSNKCAKYDGLDPSTYATNKEVDTIRGGESELEIRFAKIYDETVALLLEQNQQSQLTAAEKKRQNEAEKQGMEARTKELRNKRVQLVNERNAAQEQLNKILKETSEHEAAIDALEKEMPYLDQSMFDVNEKIKALEAEMKTLASKAEHRDNMCAELRGLLKGKQEYAVKAKQEEDAKIAELKERLEEKKRQLEEANIGLYPEIMKYRGLVDVVEVKLSPHPKRQKRATL